jgi:hypothetical protein
MSRLEKILMNMFITKPQKHWLLIFSVWQLQVKAGCTTTLAFVVASPSSKETKLEKIHCCSSERKPLQHTGWWKDTLFSHTKSAVRKWIGQPWLRWFSGVRCSVYFCYLCVDIPSGFLVTIILPFPMNVAYLCLNLLCCGKGKGCPIICQAGIRGR